MTCHGRMRNGLLLPCWLILIASCRAPAEDSPLSLADLEAYRAALSAKPGGSAPLVRFRDLWDRPEAYAGRAVTVEGQVARLFRQPKLGDFPSLVEAWVVSPSGDPFCLVFPPLEGRPIPEVGVSVRFSGTFLKKIKYQVGDTARIVPLIVGPRAPSGPSTAPEDDERSWTSIDWMMGVGASLVVALVLARRHLARPAYPLPAYETPPEFVDGEPGSEFDRNEAGGDGHESHG